MAKFQLSNKIAKNHDPDDALLDENVANYKGVFFGDDTEQKYYESGAHFGFKDLCKRLEKLLLILSPRNKIESPIITSNIKENGIINNIKQNDASRNKNLFAGTNTLKTVNFTKVTKSDQSKNLTKPSLMNNHLYSSNSNLNNGGETNFNPGLTNYRNENIFNKPIDYVSKLGIQKKKEEEKNKSDKNSLLSSINIRSSNEKFDINKTIYNNNKVDKGVNYFFMKVDPKIKSKYIIFLFLAKTGSIKALIIVIITFLIAGIVIIKNCCLLIKKRLIYNQEITRT